MKVAGHDDVGSPPYSPGALPLNTSREFSDRRLNDPLDAIRIRGPPTRSRQIVRVKLYGR
jgi:hypothetical protein